MKASETTLISIIEQVKQYVVPLFQRSYGWDKKQWDVLWDDLVDLIEFDAPRTHFIGSIVTMQTNSVPEGVPKFLLIDGQQRLTTIFLILAVVRDLARQAGNQELAEEIEQTYLVNRFKKDNDYYKLLPTQIDREAFQSIMKKENAGLDVPIFQAYAYFKKKLERSNISGETIKRMITDRLSVVSIVLDRDDNPYLVFESLNAKGAPLTQADLIRNFFFLRIHPERQEKMHAEYWEPMERLLDDRLTDYIRHFLMKSGEFVREDSVYFTLKERLGEGDAIDHLRKIHQGATRYVRLIRPAEHETEPLLQVALERLNRLNVTVYNPFLLNCYDEYDRGELPLDDFASILKCLETYLIRRFVCDIPTNQLNKILVPMYRQIKESPDEDILEGTKRILSARGFPRDSQFREDFVDSKMYRSGAGRIEVARLILETLERSHGHKERVDFQNMSIEHIMPKTLTSDWRNELGDDADDTHELYLDTIGNLTLTGYNSELSNSPYGKKRGLLLQSHLELNKYFRDVETWGREEIERRAEALAELAVGIWPSFGKEQVEAGDTPSPDAKPKSLRFLGEVHEVKTSRDVLQTTLEVLSDHDPGAFSKVVERFPGLIGPKSDRFRDSRKMKNQNLFFNVNYSTESILSWCRRIMEVSEIERDEWKLLYE